MSNELSHFNEFVLQTNFTLSHSELFMASDRTHVLADRLEVMDHSQSAELWSLETIVFVLVLLALANAVARIIARVASGVCFVFVYSEKKGQAADASSSCVCGGHSDIEKFTGYFVEESSPA